jgi:hypothetical protein
MMVKETGLLQLPARDIEGGLHVPVSSFCLKIVSFKKLRILYKRLLIAI